MRNIKTVYDPIFGEKEVEDPMGGVEFSNSAVTIGNKKFYSKGYELQTAWYVDATNGNDSNSGLTSDTAIKTFKELANRLNGENISQTTTVNLLSAVYPMTDLFELDIKLSGDNTQLLINGSGAISQTARTLTSVTAPNAASNVVASFACAGVDFSTEVGALYKDTSGNSCWIGGAGAVANSALTSAPYKVDFQNYIYNAAAFGTSAFKVTLPKVYVGNIKIQSDINTASGCSMLIRDVNFANTYYNSFNLVCVNDSQVFFERCKFEGLFYGIENAPSVAWFSCYFEQFYLYQGSAQLYGCMSRNNEIFPGCYYEFSDHTFVGGVGGSRNNESLRMRPGASSKCGNTSYIKGKQFGIWSEPGSTLMHDGTIYGAITGVAVKIDSGATITVAGKPVLTGTTGDFTLAGATTYRSWDETSGSWSAATNCTWTNFGTASTANAFNVQKGAKLIRK